MFRREAVVVSIQGFGDFASPAWDVGQGMGEVMLDVGNLAGDLGE
jgi:hypothetical protein